MPSLIERARELEVKRGELQKMFADHPERDFTAEQVGEIRKRNDELNAMQEAHDETKSIESIADGNTKAYENLNRINRPVPFSGEERTTPPDEQRGAQKSLGERFTEDRAYKSFNAHGGNQTTVFSADDMLGIAVKTVFGTTGSTLTEYDRQPGIILLGTQRLTIADLLAQGETTMNTIRYVQETSFTNAATSVAEGATKPEAAFATNEQDAPVRKIAVVAKVTDEMFADFPVIRDYIDNRLRLMIGLREEAQLLNGNGTAPNIRGILSVAGILTQARGNDPGPDAVYKGIVKVQTTGFFDPDAVVLNTIDWQNIRLLKTADGIYIWGSPADTAPSRLWGLNVVFTTAMVQGTGLVGAFKLGAQIFRRQGVTMETTNSNVDDFVNNLIAIRVEERLALAVYRPTAFATITGL